MLIAPSKPLGLDICHHMCVRSSCLYSQAATGYDYPTSIIIAAAATTTTTTSSSSNIISSSNSSSFPIASNINKNMIYLL